MKKWLVSIGVVLAFLFAVVPFLAADVTISTAGPPRDEDEGAAPADPGGPTAEPIAEPKPAVIPKLTDSEKARAEKLIQELASSDFATREAAEEALKKMGLGVLPLVKKHVTSSDAEVAERAARIVEHLQDQLPAGPSKVKVTLSLDKKQYKIGERIRATVRFANQDKKPLTLPVVKNQYPWHEAVHYVLTGPDGKVIAPERFKGLIAQAMIARLPLVLQPEKPISQNVYMSLLAELPKVNARFRKLKAAPQVQKRAQLQQAPVEKAELPAAEADKKKPAEDGKPPKVKPIGFLRDATGQYYFALAKAGKYTLKFRFIAKATKPERQERAGGPGRINQIQRLGGQIFVFRPGQPADAANAKPVKGVLESNEVAFEIVK